MFQIVDEFHHAEASTYVKLLEYLQPKVLVGLTATPERADGKDVTRWFGGKIAAELRLWEAIDRGFLVPFQYFGLRDSVDISLYWKRGRVDLEALDRVYSGHHLRARQILAALVDHVASPRRIRAVGFCAGVGHARFMAAQFSSAGLPSQALVGGEPNRDGLMRDFREGRISVLFTVDLLNEGVDVPEIDTILLLRPTESATVFLQQLGRGLRLCEGKRCLTVLDFIATADRSFRFDLRYRALVGGTRAELVRQVEEGFPVLPAGCSIQLAPDAAGVVLENLKAALSPRRDRLVAELRSLGEGCSLRAFLAHTGLELGELCRGRCFTDLKREAGFPMPPAGPEEAKFGTGLGRLLHLDDPELLRELEEEVRQAVPTMLSPVAMVTLLEEAMTQPEEAKRIFRRNPAILEELGELFPLLAEGVGHLPVRLENPAVPLKIHCRYRLEQVMAAFGAVKSGALLRPREGVWFDTQTRSDIFFVTLQKSEKDYSPGTLYEDYAISAERFHWQTQRGTTQNSERGRRNLKHREEGITPLLFVRPRRKDDMGGTVPYSFLGPVELERWEGERPISIVWRLLHPMPADIFATAKVAA